MIIPKIWIFILEYETFWTVIFGTFIPEFEA